MTAPGSADIRELVLDGVLATAPVLVYAYDEDGTCIFSEGAGLRGLGLARGEWVGRNLWTAYAGQPALVERMRRPLRGESFHETDRLGDRVLETWHLPLAPDEAGRPRALGVSIDITDQLQAEQGHRLYRAFVEAAPQFIALAELDGRVVAVNPGGRRLAGIPDDVDVTTTSIPDYLTPEGLVASVEVEQPAVIRDGRWEGESTLKYWPTGEGIPVRVSSFLVTDPVTGEPIALATVQSDLREVVEGRDAVQRLVAHQRGLLVHLHEAQEAERRRIATEIHDDTVQVMAAANIRLQAMQRALGDSLPAERQADLAALDRSVREATSRLRRLLVDLDPPEALGSGIRESLHDIAAQTLAGPAVEVDVAVSDEPSPIVTRVLARIAREALVNADKHAAARSVRLVLREQDGSYLLRVLDDGTGIEPGLDDRGPLHRGLRGIRERAESVGGTATVSRQPSGGTVVEARIPALLAHPGDTWSGPAPSIFLEQVMETISDAYIAVDDQWRCIYLNRAGYAVLRRDRRQSVVGKVVWDEVDIPAEFAAAYRRAMSERIQVEVTALDPLSGRWYYNRILPTARGLSVFGRDVTEQVMAAEATARHERRLTVWRAVARAIAAGGADDVTVVRAVAQALLDTWPLDGLRVRWGGGSVDAGDLGGPVRVLPLVLDGRPVGVAELIGESEPVDADVLELLAVRVAAGAGGADVRASARNHLAPSDVGTGHGPEDT